MSKKSKRAKLEKRRHEVVNRALGHAGVKLAIADDSGIEKKIRQIWSWADDRLAQQDPQDVDRIGALTRLQSKMSEAIDVLATIVGAALDPFPEPAFMSRTSKSPEQARKERSDAVARELLRNPEIRRAFLEHQRRLKEGTAMLNDEQLAVAKKLGMDRKTLAEISLAMLSKPSTAGGSPKASRAPELTPEQLRAARRLGIADPDAKAVAALAARMRSGARVEMQLKPAAA